MLNKKILVMILAVSLILSGCATDSAPQSQGTSSPQPDSESAGSESRIVTDVYGRQVKLPEKVETVAVIGGAARILTYAGCADKLVGVKC